MSRISSKTKAKLSTQTAVILLIAIFVVVNIVSLNLFYRFDLTENKRYTISDTTKKTLKNLDDIVTVKVFFSQKLPTNMMSLSQQVKDTLAEYETFGHGNLVVKYMDPDKEEVKTEALKLGIPQIQMNILLPAEF